MQGGGVDCGGQVLVDTPGDVQPPGCRYVAIVHEDLRLVVGDHLAQTIVLLREKQLLNSSSSK